MFHITYIYIYLLSTTLFDSQGAYFQCIYANHCMVVTRMEENLEVLWGCHVKKRPLPKLDQTRDKGYPGTQKCNAFFE